MELHESAVDIARRQALALLRRNVVGPKKYVEVTYSPYRSLMDGNASLEVDNFLKHSENELPAFAKVEISSKSISMLFSIQKSFTFLCFSVDHQVP